jgi:hypothetical protein
LSRSKCNSWVFSLFFFFAGFSAQKIRMFRLFCAASGR